MYVQLNKFPYFSVALYGPIYVPSGFFQVHALQKLLAIMSQNLLYGSYPQSGN